MIHLYIFDEIGHASSYGVGTYIRNIVSVCLDCSISVTIVTLFTAQEKSGSMLKNDVQYINIPLLRDSEGKLYDIDDKNQRKEYCQYVVSVMQSYVSDGDSLIFHLNYTQDFFLADCLKRRWSYGKIILTIHYFAWCFALLGNVSRLSKIMSKEQDELTDFEREVVLSALFEQQLFENVDKVICLSKFAYQLLSEFYGIPENKLCLIPNGIKDNSQQADKKQLRKKYGIPENEKMLLFVGRLDHKKGLDFLIKAFKELVKEENCNLHLYIIGDGDFNIYLPLCYPFWRNITFCGKILPEHVMDFYQMSDIGILPSLTEQCSFVVIEMLMSGLPIIGTNSSGLDEMIIEGVNGLKVHLQEQDEDIDFPIEELVACLNHLLQSSSLDKYGKQSRMLYLKHYNYKYMQDKLCQLYTLYLEGKEVSFR